MLPQVQGTEEAAEGAQGAHPHRQGQPARVHQVQGPQGAQCRPSQEARHQAKQNCQKETQITFILLIVLFDKEFKLFYVV